MAKNQDLSIVLCGEAGQGLQTVEKVLTKLIRVSGFHVFSTKEFMSRIRGGVNTTSIRVSPVPISAYIDRIDVLLSLSPGRTKHLQKRISNTTRIVDQIKSNMEAVGIVGALLKIDLKIVKTFLAEFFSGKGESVVQENLAAVLAGYQIGQKLDLALDFQPDPLVKGHITVSGGEAVALGALAGGCDFVSAYPMSPSTAVLTFLAQHAKEFDIVVEQVEDEIAGINMALGAWYAGGRGLASTSGGGFALMVEGLSLAGMLETPIVVHLAQRPGPATGLPTRQEQADLNFALYSGHGEFPRIILAPGSIEEAFYLSAQAFNLADKYQVPVIILTDQYLIDSYYNIAPFDLTGVKTEKQVVETAAGYQRYALTNEGISLRGIPGYGAGLVCVDSDEHDETGHITEDLVDVRPRMVEKRLKKLELFKKVAIAPTLIGPDNFQTLVVGWGSTLPMLREAIAGLKDTALLHFSQVYPVPEAANKYLLQAKRLIAVENNATGQFADLVEKKLGIKFTDRILKYDGLPFSVEELREKLRG